MFLIILPGYHRIQARPILRRLTFLGWCAISRKVTKQVLCQLPEFECLRTCAASHAYEICENRHGFQPALPGKVLGQCDFTAQIAEISTRSGWERLVIINLNYHQQAAQNAVVAVHRS
jgi:hypothetical protein